MRGALAIDEASYGPNHPDVARDLNNLAVLPQDTNRLAEAEPFSARAARIFLTSLGGDHHSSQQVKDNHLNSLQAQGLPEATIQAKLKALQPPG